MRAKSQGKFASNLQPLMVWWLGFLIFIQPIHIQFLGRELRSYFRLPLTTASLRSINVKTIMKKGKVKRNYLNKQL